MQPRTIRIPDHLTRFAEESSYNFSQEVRERITEDSIRYAVGKCAATGDILYAGGFTAVGTTTPAGKALDAPQELESIDLRNDIFERVSKHLTGGETDIPTLSYLEELGPVLYAAEVETIASAQPGSQWELTATPTSDSEPDRPLDRRVQDMLLWSAATDQDGHLSVQNIWDHTPNQCQHKIEDYVDNHADPNVTEHQQLIEVVESVR